MTEPERKEQDNLPEGDDGMRQASGMPAHLQGPIKAYADEQMIRNSVGAEYDELAEPPCVKVPRDHPLCDAVIAALRDVYDPEIPVNIYELGLIYEVSITSGPVGADVHVQMTLTSPGCPVAQDMPGMVQNALFPIEGVDDVLVDIVWDPVWDPSMMAETAKMQLNMFL